MWGEKGRRVRLEPWELATFTGQTVEERPMKEEEEKRMEPRGVGMRRQEEEARTVSEHSCFWWPSFW